MQPGGNPRWLQEHAACYGVYEMEQGAGGSRWWRRLTCRPAPCRRVPPHAEP